MSWRLRIATPADAGALEALIEESAFGLQQSVYSKAQIRAAIGPVFGVDLQMIHDRTYFVACMEETIVGCGGWSFRPATYGGRAKGNEPPVALNPRKDAARIRAFFVHPFCARRGIGAAILQASESALQDHGFLKAEIAATLVGEPLYAKYGFRTLEYFEIPLEGGLSITGARMAKDYRDCQK